MSISIHTAIIVMLIFVYISLIPVFYFVMVEVSKVIDVIVLSKQQRKRTALINERIKAKKRIPMCFLWPAILYRSIKNRNETKK